MSKRSDKMKEWLQRYGTAEVISLIATLIASLCMFRLTQSKAATAFAGTWGGNIAYFSTIILQDIRLAKRSLHAAGKPFTYRVFIKIIRALFIEFGVAEVLDTLLIRPALLYYMPEITGNLTWGLIIGKLLADITFYIPAIVFYELGKKKFRDF